jgi:hypothetical protein
LEVSGAALVAAVERAPDALELGIPAVLQGRDVTSDSGLQTGDRVLAEVEVDLAEPTGQPSSGPTPVTAGDQGKVGDVGENGSRECSAVGRRRVAGSTSATASAGAS